MLALSRAALRRRLVSSARLPAHSTCACGLSPCLAPHCVAGDLGELFQPDARSLAPYQGTPESVTDALLSLAALQPGESFVDLGAGDGRVLLAAVQRFGAGSAVGYELDPVVYKLALHHIDARLAESPELRARVRVHCCDARTAQLAGAHVVGMYLLPEGHAALEPHLARELPVGSGTRVVAHGWPVPGWMAHETLVTSMGTRLYLYRR